MADLKVIEGKGTGPKPWRRTSLYEAEQVTCWRCEHDMGVASSAVIQVILAPLRGPGGKKQGGTKSWVCAHCLARGHVTELIKG